MRLLLYVSKNAKYYELFGAEHFHEVVITTYPPANVEPFPICKTSVSVGSPGLQPLRFNRWGRSNSTEKTDLGMNTDNFNFVFPDGIRQEHIESLEDVIQARLARGLGLDSHLKGLCCVILTPIQNSKTSNGSFTRFEAVLGCSNRGSKLKAKTASDFLSAVQNRALLEDLLREGLITSMFSVEFAGDTQDKASPAAGPDRIRASVQSRIRGSSSSRSPITSDNSPSKSPTPSSRFTPYLSPLVHRRQRLRASLSESTDVNTQK
eukprot:361628_1